VESRALLKLCAVVVLALIHPLALTRSTAVDVETHALLELCVVVVLALIHPLALTRSTVVLVELLVVQVKCVVMEPAVQAVYVVLSPLLVASFWAVVLCSVLLCRLVVQHQSYVVFQPIVQDV